MLQRVGRPTVVKDLSCQRKVPKDFWALLIHHHHPHPSPIGLILGEDAWRVICFELLQGLEICPWFQPGHDDLRDLLEGKRDGRG